MRIWKRAAWRKKLLKSSSEFSAIQEDSLLRLRASSYVSRLILLQGFTSAEATKGLSDRPLETFGAVTPMLLELFCYFGKRGWCGYPVDKHAGIA